MDDHDQRFKTLLREFLPEFFELFFADWAPRFDFTGTEWLEQEAFLDPPGGEKRVLDLVAKVPTRVPVPDPAGRGADHFVIAINVEIESPERSTDVRPRMLWHYEFLRRRYGLPVFPICLFLRVGLDGLGWDAYEERLWDHKLLRFEYAYIGLPALDGMTYFCGDNLLGLALSVLMKLPASERARIKAEGLAKIVQSRENNAKKALLAECVDNYLDLSLAEQQECEKIERESQPEGEAMTGTEYRDYVSGQRKLIIKQLDRKFGELTIEQRKKVIFWPVDKLEKLALDLMDAKSLEELGITDTPPEEGK